MISGGFKYKIFGIAILLVGLQIIPRQARGQFIDLSLDIDTELSASTEQELNFGQLATNTGHTAVDLGSLNMGIFSIKALENQMLHISLVKPKVLRHNNSAIEDVVPIKLFARYGYSSQNYRDSFLLPETANIRVETNPDPGPWNTIFIFIYGSVNIGDIPGGVYSNKIVLNVEYI